MATEGDYRTAVLIMELVRMVRQAPYRKVPVNTLAEKLGVHRRTIRRWVNGLERISDEDGLPIVELEPGRPRQPAMVKAPFKRGTATAAELRALALGLASTRYLAATGATDLEEHAERLLARLGGHDPDARSRLASAFHYIPFGAKSYAGHPDEIDAVFSGVLFRHTLEFDYRRPGGGEPFRVSAEPWSLVFYRDALYMLGRRLHYKDVVLRTYAIDRMSNVQPDRNARFEVPEDFDPSDHFGDLGLWKPPQPRERLEVLFTPREGALARERQWPGLVEWSIDDDGRHRLVLDIRISPEVEAWLLSYGPSVEVVGPPRLRALIAARVASMNVLYQAP